MTSTRTRMHRSLVLPVAALFLVGGCTTAELEGAPAPDTVATEEDVVEEDVVEEDLTEEDTATETETDTATETETEMATETETDMATEVEVDGQMPEACTEALQLAQEITEDPAVITDADRARGFAARFQEVGQMADDPELTAVLEGFQNTLMSLSTAVQDGDMGAVSAAPGEMVDLTLQLGEICS